MNEDLLVDPPPNLAETNVVDVHRPLDRPHRHARVKVLLAAGTAAALAVGALAVFLGTSGRTDPATTPVSTPPTEIDVRSLGGLIVTGAGSDLSYRHATLERVDVDAGNGPQAVVVRFARGTLGDRNAIVTYPAASSIGADPNPGSSSDRSARSIVVRRPGGTISVRAVNLDEREMAAIAMATDVVDGRPVVSLPASVHASVVAAASLRPPVIREARYGCDALGEGDILGALCYTGLATSPGFEDAILGLSATPGPPVHGHESIVSSVGGGNATMAWEVVPGVIAYVGYSGSSLHQAQIDALGRLAERTILIAASDWAATEPQTGDQTNTWS